MADTFTPENGVVYWTTNGGSVALTIRDCDRLLDLFESLKGPAAAILYNALYDAARAVGGLARCSSRRTAA